MNSDVLEAAPAHRPVISLAWFLKRMVLAIFILVTSFGGLAWLTYASIDPRLEAAQRTTIDAQQPTETGAINPRF